MFEDVDDENIGCQANGFDIDEQEFGYDEELNIIPDCGDLWVEGWVVNGRKSTQKMQSTITSGNNSNYFKQSLNR